MVWWGKLLIEQAELGTIMEMRPNWAEQNPCLLVSGHPRHCEVGGTGFTEALARAVPLGDRHGGGREGSVIPICHECT